LILNKLNLIEAGNTCLVLIVVLVLFAGYLFTIRGCGLSLPAEYPRQRG